MTVTDERPTVKPKHSIARPPGPKPPTSESGMKPWAPRGACRSVDPDWFFGPDGERGAERAVREAVAKKICARCPVIDSCLAWAMAKNEAGYWAGTSEEERTTIRRKATRVRSKSESAS